MQDLVALAEEKGKRPLRHLLLIRKVEASPWDAGFFPGGTEIIDLDLSELRQKAMSPGPLTGLAGSPAKNRSYIITGLCLTFGEVDGDVGLMRRKVTGDLGLQTCEVNPDRTPVVQLPGPEGCRSEAQTRASKCVSGLVKLLRISVPGFWRREWSRFDLKDFQKDIYKLTVDTVLYLTGVLKWAMIVQEGKFLHDSYLAYVWAQAQGVCGLGSGMI